MPAYYCFFPGDYLRDTIHLGQLEDLAYRRLLDLYYAKGKPLPNDRAYIMRAIRASDPDLQNAADNILSEFFTLSKDGWRNEKADRELEYMHVRSDKARKAVNIRWERERSKNKGISDTNALRSNNPSITPTPTPTRRKDIGTSASRFVPPSLEELEAYIAERRYSVNARRFLDHYQANGWKVGRNAMKDWQAAVRTWAAKAKDAQPQAGRLAI